MSCGQCIRWAKLQRPRLAPPNWSTRYGFCRWPGMKPAPYWFDPAQERWMLFPDTAGDGCPAFRMKKPR